MSENENVGIELDVDADAALNTFQQLSTAARAADADIQSLKERLSTLTNTQAAGTATPDISQTRDALNARRAAVQAQAMDFVGANPQAVTQPLPDTLAQFQQAMTARAQQQQAQRARQDQQDAAGIERPARYGYDTPPSLSQPPAVPTPIAPPPAPLQVTAPLLSPAASSAIPQAPKGADGFAQALTTHGTPGGAPSNVPGQVDPSVQTMQQLATAARQADTAIQQLKQHQLELFNAMPRGSQPPAASYSEALGELRQMDPSLVQQLHPEIAQTQMAIQSRQAAITSGAMDFTSANPQAAGQPVTDQLLTQFQAFMTQQQQAQQATAGVNYQAPPPPPGQEGLRYGPAVPPEMDRLARYGYDKAQAMDARDAAKQQGALGGTGSGGSSTNDTTQQDRAGTQLGERFAQALTRSGVGMVTGGIQGAASAAGMGATGDLVSGLARPLMAALGDALPLAAGALGVVGGAVGIGLGVNALQSKYAGEQQGLAGSVGTTTGATPSSELTTAQQAGWAMMYHEADSVAAARQLGDMGVQSGQLGAGLTASMALSRVGGIGLDQTTNLTGSLMQSGMSGNQVGDYFAHLDQAARQSGVSVARLTEGIVHLNQAAGIGQISVNGLAAAQAVSDQSGTKIDIAQAMSGAIGATGTTALAQGALLGLNPAQFEAATQDPARLLDAYAGLAKRYDVGTGGVQVAQQAMSAAGFDFSKMDSHQADVFTRKLVSEGPNAAQRYEDTLTRKENAPGAPGPHNFAELTKAGVTVANDITGAGDQLKIKVEQAAAGFVRTVDGVKLTTPLTAPAAAAQSAANEAQQAIIDAARHRGPAAQLKMVQTAPNPTAKAQALLGYEAITSGQDYANDPNAAGQMDASGSAQFGPLSEYSLSQARQSGTWVGGGPGKGSFVSADTFHAYEQAARKTGTPLAVLLAQGKQEATINGAVDPLAGTGPGHGGNLPGIGLGQWTPGPHNENLPTVEHYLGMASKDLGLGAVTGQNWRQAATNPRVSALATGIYDADLYQSHGPNWEKALAPYNGTGPQAQAYGASVTQAALKVEVQLGGSVDITQHGQKVGSAQAGQHIRAKATHSIDPHKKHIAAQSYGPQDRTPPDPGLHLPRPIT